MPPAPEIIRNLAKILKVPGEEAAEAEGISSDVFKNTPDAWLDSALRSFTDV
jgi:hypothetical protein